MVMEIPKTSLIEELQNELMVNEKVIKLDYFWGAVVMVFSSPLFP